MTDGSAAPVLADRQHIETASGAIQNPPHYFASNKQPGAMLVGRVIARRTFAAIGAAGFFARDF